MAQPRLAVLLRYPKKSKRELKRDLLAEFYKNCKLNFKHKKTR